jgi:hypothetical protein
VAPVSATFGFLGVDGAAFYTTATSTGRELFRAGRGAPSRVLELFGFLNWQFGSRSLSLPPTSDDGRSILSFDRTDPNTGLVNIRLSSTRGRRPPVTLESEPNSTIAGPPFTSDSSRAIYAKITDLSTFVADLVVADATHRDVYSNDVWSWDVGKQGLVLFNERALLDPSAPFFATADLRSVNTGGQEQPRLIAEQAYFTYFPSHHGTAVAYTTDQDLTAPGLYVARMP